MTPLDTLKLSFSTVASYRTRSLLIVLAMALGVAAVVVLTALGDGARRYVVGQFSSLGTNLVIVLPGRAETSGGFPGAALGQTPRDLTLEDARFVRQLPQVRRLAPLNVGVAELTAGGRLREVTVLGSTADLLPIRHMKLAQGSFLAHGSERSAQIVLGSQLAREFFPDGRAIGQRIRLADSRFLVSGVLSPQGESMGFNTDEIAIIPIDYAQELFNTESLFRILVEARSRDAIEPAKAAISLAVAGILVMNVMLVAVAQRTTEIGLLKAIGAPAADIRRLFFAEALWLSLAGGAMGFALGHAGAWLIRLAYPLLPAWPPAWASVAGIATALLTGIIASLLPASRAAKLDPVLALSGK